ncbi:MAG: hypothetical protein KBA31_16355 [Alphaproteobacteria bacterium]|nr:hypothetical protein [Alphaproteobacteria bacterium]
MKRHHPIMLAIATACALVIASCATMPEKVRADVRSVGVVSLLGDSVTLFYFGKFFDGHRNDYPVAGAGFDDMVERVVEARVQQLRPGVAVKRIRIEKNEVIRQSTSGLLSMYNADVADIRAALRPWAAQNNVDTIVIIRQINGAVPIQAPRSNFSGLGLYASYDVQPPHPVASLGIVVWDGKTLDFITESELFLVGYDPGAYTLDNKMQDNLAGARRERLLNSLRVLISRATPVLMSRVGL